MTVSIVNKRLSLRVAKTQIRNVHKSRYIPTHLSKRPDSSLDKKAHNQNDLFDGEYSVFITQPMEKFSASTSQNSLVTNFPAKYPHRVSAASSTGVNETIRNAQVAFDAGVWSRAPAITRSKVLSQLARALEARIPELAQIETLQTGRTLREMNAQLGRLPEWL
ncbi:hypothetical protein AAF712_005352 [Marasmius tenuissimus]|uniref:Aldehyde dehydrogenase domain-containing protein n=1 Tax=Marasmius tenuissimus TaxID=585030 RepID=A0ABR3A119_9AGAR